MEEKKNFEKQWGEKIFRSMKSAESKRRSLNRYDEKYIHWFMS